MQSLRRPWRILFTDINADGTVGGSHRVLLELLKHIDRDRFHPIVLFYQTHALVDAFGKVAPVFITPFERRLAVAEELPTLWRIAARVPFARRFLLLLQKLYNFVFSYVPQIVRLLRLISRERVDMVCINNAPLFTEWLVACKLLRRPCIAFYRGTLPFPKQQARLVRYYDAVLSISNAVTENARVHGADVSRFALVYDGIDVDAVRAQAVTDREALRAEFLRDANQKLVGVVNNIKEWKGQHVAIEAMVLLNRRRGDVTCLLVGDVAQDHRSYFQSLVARVKDAGLQDKVIFTGHRSDAAALLQALDVVLHTSVGNEGFPRVILEAMLLGRPIVASSAGPNAEMIEDGVSGLLVPPGDASALADSTESLLRQPERASALGKAARSRVEQLFNIDINVRRTEEIFTQVLEARGR